MRRRADNCSGEIIPPAEREHASFTTTSRLRAPPSRFAVELPAHCAWCFILPGGPVCSNCLLCDSQGLDALDFRLDSLSRIPKVDGALRVEPELRRIAEQPRQAQGHRRTDRPPTAQQLVDRLAGDAQSLG